MRNWIIVLGCFFAYLGMQSPLSAHLRESNPCCESIFGGLYIGGNAGFFNLQTSTFDADLFLQSQSTTKERDTSRAAGIQLGYDWVCHQRLLGLLIDWNWANAHTNSIFLPGSSSTFHRASLHWFSTFRARAGLSLCNVIIYMTGGAALADFKHRFNNVNFSFFGQNSFDKKYWGWTLGLGTEFALWCRWSLSAEILYLNFQHKKYTAYRTMRATGVRSAFRFDDYPTAWVGRLGLNYHFSLCNFGWGR